MNFCLVVIKMEKVLSEIALKLGPTLIVQLRDVLRAFSLSSSTFSERIIQAKAIDWVE